jgi:hypothetical protein
MTERKTTPDPEDLTEEERRELLKAAGARARRQLENEAIAKELARQAQDAERRANS